MFLCFNLFATCTVDVCEGNINISLLIALYFPQNWVLHVLFPLEYFHLMASQDTICLYTGMIYQDRDLKSSNGKYKMRKTAI